MTDGSGFPQRASDLKRSHDRAINEMLGMLRGIVCDGVVNDDEVFGFRNWLGAHPECATCWPGNVLATRLARIVEHGVVAPGDRLELYEMFCDTLGDGDISKHVPESYSTRLPFDDPPPVLTFAGETFCLTGAFVYGERSHCEEAIVRRGGIFRNTVIMQPMTLVVGGYGNDAWAHSPYGRKIEHAMEYREKGVSISIVCEECWTEALHRMPVA